MNPRPDLIRIQDILEAISTIEDYKDSLHMYERDEYIKQVFFSAILYHLVIIGEAVNNMTVRTKSQYKFDKWQKVVALRNQLVHKYSGIDRDMILNILANGLIELKLALDPESAV